MRRRSPRPASRLATPALLLGFALLAAGLAACSSAEPQKASGPTSSTGSPADRASPATPPKAPKVDRSAPAMKDAPQLGACRQIAPKDSAQKANTVDAVDCGDGHTAQTFVVGAFPEKVTRGTAYGSPSLGRFIYDECTDRFAKFVGGDESIVIRSLVSWVWFRPTQDQWNDGSRWFRCDIVGGTPDAARYLDLPRTGRGLFSRGPVDAWMQCVKGASITAAPATPCTRAHDWRAISTIKVGKPHETYPGDKIVAARSRDFCSDSVAAMQDYPPEFDFAYAWFHEAEWKTGNRRSVCWAKTEA